MKTRYWLKLVALVLAVACSSVEKREEKKNVRSLHRLILQNLMVRRPAGEGADPRVGPGGVDYNAASLPNAKFDCETLDALYQVYSLESVRSCLSSVPARSVIRYRLRRLQIPELILDEENSEIPDSPDGKAAPFPACVREMLGKLPVPREIIFQSNEEGSLNCYSSRLDVEADEIPGLGVKWPLSKTFVKVEFPLDAPVNTDRKAISLLASWSLSPFFGEKSDEIPAHLVPDHLCGKCYGKNKRYKPDDALPELWPSRH